MERLVAVNLSERTVVLGIFAPLPALVAAGLLSLISESLAPAAIAVGVAGLLVSELAAIYWLTNAMALDARRRRRWYVVVLLLPLFVGPLLVWARLITPPIREGARADSPPHKSPVASYFRYIDETLPITGALTLVVGVFILLTEEGSTAHGLLAMAFGSGILILRLWEQQAVAEQRVARRREGR